MLRGIMPHHSTATESQDHTTQLSGRLFREYIRHHLGKLLLAALFMIIAGASTAGNAWLMQPVLDEIFLERNQDMLLIIPLAILAIGIIKSLSTYTQSVLMKIIGQRVVADMQLALYTHLLAADVALHQKHASGKLVSRFSNDIAIIRKNLTNVLTGLAKETVTLIFLLGVMIFQSWELSLIALVVFPVAIYPILKLGRRMRRVSRDTQEELERFTAGLDDTFQGVRIVKSYGQEAHEISRASSTIERIFKHYVRAAKTESAASPMMEGLAGFAIAAVVWYGGSQVLSGETTPGAFFSFIAALLMAYKPLKSLSGINTNLQEGLAAIQRFYHVVDTAPLVQDCKDSTPLTLPGNKATLQCNDVGFGYEKNGQAALESVSFTIPAGQRAALVGPSGSGKSTIMNLILRFYDPTRGSITLNGHDLRTITLQSLRQHIAVVNQEATLFDDTIRNNILYGKLDASEEELVEAAKLADAHGFIIEQPQGYDTPIGQHGVKLSGGQRQRIAIARAMLKNAPILLLDEATSALDTTSERQVQQALDRLMQGRTTLVVAHRLSTIVNADCIYVLEKGHIVEQGTHPELLAKNGAYATLHHQQFADTKSP